MWASALVAVCGIAIVAWLARQTPTTANVPPDKVVIAGLAAPGAGLFFVAQEQGYFRQQGLDVELQLHLTGKLALDALLGGKADLAIAGDVPFIFATLANRQLDILSNVDKPDGGIAIIAFKSRVPTPGDLKGKRLGVTFVSAGQFFADTFLLVNGVPQSEVSVVNVPPEEIAAALIDGKIDAACMWQPYLEDTKTLLGDRGVVFPSKGLYTFRLNLVANRGYAIEYPHRVRKVLSALLEAQRYTVENPTLALEIISRSAGIEVATFKQFFDPAEYDLGLEQALLLALDDQTRWAIKNGFVKADKMPNYLNYIQADGLGSVSPELIKIIR